MNGTLRITRREGFLLSGFTAAALLLRLLSLRFEYAISPDGYYYASLGQKLMSGDLSGGVSLYWPPLYPLLVGISSMVFGDPELGGRMVSVLLGSALVILEYLLVRSVVGKRAAVVGAFLTVVHPLLLSGSTKLLSEITLTFFLLSAVLLGVLGLFEGRRRLLLWSGLAFGACYLTKPEAFGLFLVSLAATALYFVGRPGGLRSKLGSLLLLAGGFALLAAPYLSYLRYETGVWTISMKVDAFYRYRVPNWRTLIAGRDITYADTFFGDIRTDDVEPSPDAGRPPSGGAPAGLGTAGLLRRMVRELSRQYSEVFPHVFPPFVLLLAGMGLLTRPRERAAAGKELYVLAFVAAALLGYGIFEPKPRYMIFQVPLVFLWVAAGIVELARRLNRLTGKSEPPGRRRSEAAIIPVLVLALVASMAEDLTRPARKSRWEDAHEMKIAGRWIRNRSGGGSLILANSPVVAFYAGTSRHFYVPNEPLDRVIDLAEHRGADYLVLDERKALQWRLRSQTPLFEGKEPPPRLRLVYRVDEAEGARVLVYELVPSAGDGHDRQPAPPSAGGGTGTAEQEVARVTALEERL